MKRLGVIVNPSAGNGAGRIEGQEAINELQRESEVLDLTGNSMKDSEKMPERLLPINCLTVWLLLGATAWLIWV